ncbi:MAG: hypothetical protein RJB66_908 [Pseudomonadota bacterium]|jgi:chemotaxis protein CheX
MGAAPKPHSTLFFDKNFINSFVESVINTLGNMAQTTAKPGRPTIAKKTEFQCDILGIIDIHSGAMHGTLYLCFPRQTVFKIIEAMIDEIHTEMNEHVVDAVGEMTNMIYGQAKIRLNDRGFEFEMAIPKVALPPYPPISPNGITALQLPFSTQDDLTFYLEIVVKT